MPCADARLVLVLVLVLVLPGLVLVLLLLLLCRLGRPARASQRCGTR